jgi:hypothetical protein
MNVGVGTNVPSTSGTIYVYRNGITSNEGNVTIENENIGGRQVIEYAGITTTSICSYLKCYHIQILKFKISQHLTLILVITC